MNRGSVCDPTMESDPYGDGSGIVPDKGVASPDSRAPPAPQEDNATDCKRPVCDEPLSKPGALKLHLRVHDGGPAAAAARGSSGGAALTPCTFRSCRLAFRTPGEMEGHRRSHAPLHCPRCRFVARSAEHLNRHCLEHDAPPDDPRGREMVRTTTGTEGDSQRQASARPTRKRKPNPDDVSSPSHKEGSVDLERPGHVRKRGKAQMEKDKAAAVINESDTPPSKDFLAEGSEQIYRTHTCPKCRRCFKMRSHLQEHLHLHFPNSSLQCPTCSHYFTSKSKLRIHMLREAGKKVHRCPLCEYSAVEQNAIRRHLASMHGDEAGGDRTPNAYPCPTCGQSFGQSRSLKSHMKTHNVLPDHKAVACFQDGCSFQSSSRKELLGHASKVHGVKAVLCRHHACQAIFGSEKDMEDHYRTHLAYHCPECDFSCSNKSVFLQHQRQGHAGKEELSCDFCSFVTFNPVELEQHTGHLHANEKIHRCPQCSYVTSHKRGLKRHMLMHSGEKPHKCSQCDFRCRDESYLAKHMLTHSDDKNFMCSECGYVTKWKHYLNVHMRKHTGDLRYQCDQCSYRCHRMDQLNSHKLRHQSKSLMCEICAFACKRKYELRNHMLTKHSAGEKQETVYDCKYCSYTTCYRQALQNHENCKHTKLKEFRCALCSYCSFSSISLFLHKRKVHGYVPGDKAWLDNYTSKEKERNSIECVQDFYKKPSRASGQPEGTPPSLATEDRSEEPGSAGLTDKNTHQETVGVSEPLNKTKNRIPEGVDEGGASSSNGTEEYCTLVLTTLSTTEYEASPVVDGVCPPTKSFNLYDPDSDQPKEKEQATRSVRVAEEDGAALEDDGCDQSEQDESDGPPSNVSHTCAVTGTEEIIGSSERSVRERHLDSEAMKKHDRDQAEAMVLEGRVKMLVVQSKDVYRCDKCTYVTRKENTLKYHCQFVCRGRSKGHRCQACGAQFKQRRGLNTHLLRKCPARQRKTRTFKSISTACPAAGEALPLSRSGQESTHRREGIRAHSSTGDKSIFEKAASSDGLQSRRKEIIQKYKNLKVKLGKKQLRDDSETPGSLNNQRFYMKRKGKFTCKLCNFSSRTLATVKRHCSLCRKSSKDRDDQSHTEVADEDRDRRREEEDLPQDNNGRTVNVLMKSCGQNLSCPSCPFKCSQRRALVSHERRGCLRADEIQCQLCSFVAKSQSSLTNHVSVVHDKAKLAVAKPKRLHCEHCPFTCKQERCMLQHVAVKHKGSRPHRCRYCPFSTTRRYRLEEHESLHTGVGRHVCGKCDKTFGTITKLRQHKTRVHDRQPSHFCSLCDFGGYTLDDVRRHNLRCHTGDLQHTCAHCQVCFSSDVALRNHCKRVHQLQDSFACPECAHTCGSEAALKAHRQSRHPVLKCATCQVCFDTKEGLEEHQRTHLAHRCQLCAFASRTRQVLAQHLLDVHEEGSAADKPLKCSNCEFGCHHQLVLEQHLRSHGGKRLYKCADCEYSTQNKQKITWHIRIHTGEKPYSCEQCSYTCADPSRLKCHMRVHQEEKKYLCTMCGYKCKWVTQLKYHMTKHTGEKAYACEECDYRTNRADALRAHRDTQHCDLRSFVCEKCGKAFKTRFILKTHQRQHSDERPYTCGLCHKAFRWPAGLRHHYLSHTKQQPFSCRHCSYRAKQKFQVVKHLQRHHPDESAERGVAKDSEAACLTLREAMEGALDGSAGGLGGKEECEGREEPVLESATQRDVCTKER